MLGRMFQDLKKLIKPNSTEVKVVYQELHVEKPKKNEDSPINEDFIFYGGDWNDCIDSKRSQQLFKHESEYAKYNPITQEEWNKFWELVEVDALTEMHQEVLKKGVYDELKNPVVCEVIRDQIAQENDVYFTNERSDVKKFENSTASGLAREATNEIILKFKNEKFNDVFNIFFHELCHDQQYHHNLHIRNINTTRENAFIANKLCEAEAFCVGESCYPAVQSYFHHLKSKAHQDLKTEINFEKFKDMDIIEKGLTEAQVKQAYDIYINVEAHKRATGQYISIAMQPRAKDEKMVKRGEELKLSTVEINTVEKNLEDWKKVYNEQAYKNSRHVTATILEEVNNLNSIEAHEAQSFFKNKYPILRNLNFWQLGLDAENMKKYGFDDNKNLDKNLDKILLDIENRTRDDNGIFIFKATDSKDNLKDVYMSIDENHDLMRFRYGTDINFLDSKTSTDVIKSKIPQPTKEEKLQLDNLMKEVENIEEKGSEEYARSLLKKFKYEPEIKYNRHEKCEEYGDYWDIQNGDHYQQLREHVSEKNIPGAVYIDKNKDRNIGVCYYGDGKPSWLKVQEPCYEVTKENTTTTDGVPLLEIGTKTTTAYFYPNGKLRSLKISKPKNEKEEDVKYVTFYENGKIKCKSLPYDTYSYYNYEKSSEKKCFSYDKFMIESEYDLERNNLKSRTIINKKEKVGIKKEYYPDGKLAAKGPVLYNDKDDNINKYGKWNVHTSKGNIELEYNQQGDMISKLNKEQHLQISSDFSKKDSKNLEAANSLTTKLETSQEDRISINENDAGPAMLNTNSGR